MALGLKTVSPLCSSGHISGGGPGTGHFYSGLHYVPWSYPISTPLWTPHSGHFLHNDSCHHAHQNASMASHRSHDTRTATCLYPWNTNQGHDTSTLQSDQRTARMTLYNRPLKTPAKFVVSDHTHIYCKYLNKKQSTSSHYYRYS